MVDDVSEVIRTCGGPVDLVGYSMGARVSLAVAAWKPELVRRLVLESGSPGLEATDDRTARVAADEALATRISSGGIDAFREAWRSLPVFDSLAGHMSAVAWSRVEAQRAANDPAALATVLRGLGTGAQPSLWGQLAGIRHPILLLTGCLDAKFTALAERMAAALPCARHVSVPDAGHRIHLERPRAWVRVVKAFLDGGSGAPDGAFPT